MPRNLSPAQRANQVTFVLKGHLKNAQIAYLRVAILLAKVRDERLYAALKYRTIHQYAVDRLGLGQASVDHYLQIYEWARKYHRDWLAAKPEGFIPQLTDAYALMWIDGHKADEHLSDELRRELAALRTKALAGKLSLAEFQAFRAKVRGHVSPLRALLSTLRVAKRRSAEPGVPADVGADLGRLVDRVTHLLDKGSRLELADELENDVNEAAKRGGHGAPLRRDRARLARSFRAWVHSGRAPRPGLGGHREGRDRDRRAR